MKWQRDGVDTYFLEHETDKADVGLAIKCIQFGIARENICKKCWIDAKIDQYDVFPTRR